MMQDQNQQSLNYNHFLLKQELNFLVSDPYELYPFNVNNQGLKEAFS